MNSARIVLLDDASINKIAAGEVIDRPASVVKELVENSLDAGAKRIEVEIEAGGIGKIKVSDDGTGMSGEDLRMAVLRHATSKIRNADELATVSSLGFRGEALPSIASVSRFQLISRRPQDPIGMRLIMEGGQLSDVLECGTEVGTIVMVNDLFFNTPARLKFMKTASAESSHIHDAVVRLSISRPDVTFRLINNGRLSLHTPGTGRLPDTLAALYGPETLQQLFSVRYESQPIRITGFAGRPSVRKGSRQWQTFTVNRRVVGSRLLNRAVDSAYQTLLPQGSYPLVSLQIEIPPPEVDVNVHPQKAEVKFQDERGLFRAVHAALKEVLTAPETPADAAAVFNHAGYRPQIFSSFVQETLPIPPESIQAKSFDSEQVNYSGPTPVLAMIATDDAGFVASRLTEAVPAAGSEQSALKALAQYHRCYILATDDESLYIVDQHAAHERLLFDLLSSKPSTSAYQTLLIPKVFDLDPLETQAAETYANELATLGFVFDWIGPSAVRLNELPTHIPPSEAENLFRQILTSTLSLKTPDLETFRQLWIETAACHMAVRAGQSLNTPQMQGLLDDLMRSERPYTCPHGRPTLIRFTENDLARLFKRV